MCPSVLRVERKDKRFICNCMNLKSGSCTGAKKNLLSSHQSCPMTVSLLIVIPAMKVQCIMGQDCPQNWIKSSSTQKMGGATQSTMVKCVTKWPTSFHQSLTPPSIPPWPCRSCCIPLSHLTSAIIKPVSLCVVTHISDTHTHLSTQVFAELATPACLHHT